MRSVSLERIYMVAALTRYIVLSRYLWRIAGKTPSDWEMKGVAIAAYTLAVICKFSSLC